MLYLSFKQNDQSCVEATSVLEKTMSDEELKAELERLRQENAALKIGSFRPAPESQRERRRLGLWHRSIPRDAV